MTHDPLETCVISRLVEAQAARHAERVAFVVDHHDLPAEEVTFGDLAVRGNQLAHELRRAGLGAGDRVAVMLRNLPECGYAYAAHSQLGIETVPIDPRSRGEKLRYFLDFAECKAMITGDEVVADDSVAADIGATGLPAWVASSPEGRARGLDP